MHTLKRLEVYIHSLELLQRTWGFVDSSQIQKSLTMKEQLLRAALSIPLNIAEGYGNTDSKFSFHLRIAIGSANEVVSIYTAVEMIFKENTASLQEEYIYVGKRLTAFRKSLNTKRKD